MSEAAVAEFGEELGKELGEERARGTTALWHRAHGSLPAWPPGRPNTHGWRQLGA